jgi:hypothetical protein
VHEIPVWTPRIADFQHVGEWGTAKPWLWGKEVGGNLWRTTGDIKDRWGGKEKWPDGSCCNYGMVDILDQEADLHSYAGPGHWNDSEDSTSTRPAVLWY